MDGNRSCGRYWSIEVCGWAEHVRPDPLAQPWTLPPRSVPEGELPEQRLPLAARVEPHHPGVPQALPAP